MKQDGTVCEYTIEQVIEISIDALIDRGRRFTIKPNNNDENDMEESNDLEIS